MKVNEVVQNVRPTYLGLCALTLAGVTLMVYRIRPYLGLGMLIVGSVIALFLPIFVVWSIRREGDYDLMAQLSLSLPVWGFGVCGCLLCRWLIAGRTFNMILLAGVGMFVFGCMVLLVAIDPIEAAHPIRTLRREHASRRVTVQRH